MRNLRTNTKVSLAIIGVGLALLMGACGQASRESTTPDRSSTTTLPAVADATTTAPPLPTTTLSTVTTVPPSQSDTTEVLVYLFGGPEADSENYDCGAVAPVTRLVEPPELLTGAVTALVGGPTDEELLAGYGSWFSTETGWSVDSVTISDGVARIDFSEDSAPIPNASTSCGSMALRAQLDSTATQFPAVDRTVYSFGGDVAAFYHWLEADVPEV